MENGERERTCVKMNVDMEKRGIFLKKDKNQKEKNQMKKQRKEMRKNLKKIKEKSCKEE